jgi:DNA-binding MarR family transcriptional regulator
MATEHRSMDLIRKLQLLLRRVCDAELQPYGLSFSQFVVLRAVAECPDASLAGLAGCSGMSKQAVHQVLHGLRAASLVAAVKPIQYRGRPVELTATGGLLLSTATDVMERAEERMLAGISLEDRDRVTLLLRRCIQNLETPHRSPEATERPRHPSNA